MGQTSRATPSQDVSHLGGRGETPTPPPHPHLSLLDGLGDSHPMLVAHHVSPLLYRVCAELWEGWGAQGGGQSQGTHSLRWHPFQSGYHSRCIVGNPPPQLPSRVGDGDQAGGTELVSELGRGHQAAHRDLTWGAAPQEGIAAGHTPGQRDRTRGRGHATAAPVTSTRSCSSCSRVSSSSDT